MSDFREVEPGVWSIIEGTRSFELRVAAGEVLVNGRAITVDVTDPREWNPKAGRGSSSAGAQLKAPMPGKVVRVMVAVGDRVAIGQACLVVEAMKMQNELKSPRDGLVTAVTVSEHEAVIAGMMLVSIE